MIKQISDRKPMHLYFASFNDRAVHFLTCAVGILAILKCYKTESLHAVEEKKTDVMQ